VVKEGIVHITLRRFAGPTVAILKKIPVELLD